MTPGPPMDLEEIRTALRERGYLRTAAGRFFLGDVLRPHPWTGFALRAAARGAVPSGILLGAGLYLLSLLGGWPADASPRDLVLLFLYLAAAGLLVFFALFLAVALAVRVHRALSGPPRGRIPRHATWGASILGLGVFSYLAFWWGGRASALLGHAPAAWESALALLLAVLLALGIAAASRYVFLALLFRAGGPVEVPDRMPIATVAALLAGAMAVGFFLMVRRGGGPEAGQRFEPPAGWQDGGLSLTVLGIDGAGEAVSPSVQGYIIPIRTEAGEIPPAVWATYASGFPPERHGVTGFTTRGLLGLTHPVPGDSPAGSVVAFLDWLLPRSRFVRIGGLTGSLRREKYVFEAASEAGIPTAVYNWWGTLPSEEVTGWVVSQDQFPAGGIPPGRSLDEAVLRRVAEEGQGARLLAVYLPGRDIDGSDRDAAPIPAVLSAGGPGRIVARIEDPGRSAHRGALPARLILLGEGIVSGRSPEIHSPLDVAPTLAVALGLPLSGAWEGRPVLAAFRPEFLAAHPPVTASGYGRRGPFPGGLDAEGALERLRSLGYIQ